MSVENDARIVVSITKGIKLSDILLYIVSNKTKLSWWVPYEIGVAATSRIKIASIKTKQFDDFPSFLKTQKTINNLTELIEFVLKNKNLGYFFYSAEEARKIRQNETGELEEYFN